MGFEDFNMNKMLFSVWFIIGIVTFMNFYIVFSVWVLEWVCRLDVLEYFMISDVMKFAWTDYYSGN